MGSLASGHGLCLQLDESSPVRILTEAHLREIERTFSETFGAPAGTFPPPTPLSGDRLARLTRVVALRTIEWRSPPGRPILGLTLRLAGDGGLPCLYAGIWLGEEIEFPGGFLTVDGQDREVVTAVQSEFRSWRQRRG